MRETGYFPLTGGIDTTTPAILLNPGQLIMCQNYVVVSEGGYARIGGFEAFDGKAKPSSLLSSDYDYDDDLLHAAMEIARADIGEVPGSGKVLGVWAYGGDIYAFRNNADGDEAFMYKSSSTGWVLVTTPTLSPSGRYEFLNHNFGGAASTSKMYGCDGVNKAFRFDGTTFTQITTSLPSATPSHIATFKEHLFLSYLGGVEHSNPGDPMTYDAVSGGAGAIEMPDVVTGMLVISGDAMVINTRNIRTLLTGSGSTSWNLSLISNDSGAIEWTMQTVGIPIFLDDLGITALTMTNAFGDFKSNTISAKYNDLLETLRSSVISSIRVREKDQYRIFFESGEGIVVTLKSGKVAGSSRIDYGIPVRCCCSSEDESGNEILLFGSDDGFVYQMDSGNNFNGEPIDAWIRLAYNHFGYPTKRKKFYKIVVEMSSMGTFPLYVLPDFSYGSLDYPSHPEITAGVLGGGGFWDSSYWEEFNWDSQVVETAYAYIRGVGTNMSLYLRTNSMYEKGHVIQGIIAHYSKMGDRR